MNIKQKIIDHHKELGYKTDEKGYVQTNEENLLATYLNWIEVKNELSSGDGGELTVKKDRVNFQAVHSSCALCVNSFAMVKYKKNDISLFGANGFQSAVFEKKLNTGISTPNLDFYLLSDTKMIGIESKFTEILQSKLPNKNLEKYLSADLKLPQEVIRIMEYYMNCDEKFHLDIAQLLKHIIGLSKEKLITRIKTASLIYLYWLPLNWRNIDIYQKHEEEIKSFKEKIAKLLIPFSAYSFMEFFDMLDKNKNMEGVVKRLRGRYLFEV